MANCESDINSTLIDAFSSQVDVATPSVTSTITGTVAGTVFSDLDTTIDVNTLPQQNALYYVTGYIGRKYLSKHKCDECRRGMPSSMSRQLQTQAVCFLQKKMYENIQEGHKLFVPTSEFLHFINDCEDVFERVFSRCNAFVECMSANCG